MVASTEAQGAAEQANNAQVGEAAVEPVDGAGLALSGGGIRSATFNLGLLQRLHDLKLLRLFDYASTVSGGGYIGTWWARYRLRQQKELRAQNKTPQDLDDEQRDRLFFPKWGNGDREPKEISHLRRFSNFIVPRLGLTREMGNAVVTAVSALVLSLLAVNALLGLAVLASWCLLETYQVHFVQPLLRQELPTWFTNSFVPCPAAHFVALAIVVLAVRLLALRFVGKPILRWLRWCNALQSLFLLVAAVLGASQALWYFTSMFSAWLGIVPVAGAAASSAALTYLTRRLSKITRLLDKAGALRRRLLTPKVLAYVVVILGALSLGIASRALDPTPLAATADGAEGTELIWSRGAQFKTLLCVVLLSLWLFDPQRVGMHGFYKGRLNRVYQGDPGDGSTKSLPDDDVPVANLRGLTSPEHLICAAANDVGSDTLHNLDRGSFHACFSGNGLHVGPHRHPWSHDPNWEDLDERMTLGSAMTSSAAAFNSVMGSQSKRLGWAVSFVMTALNLRLGIWVPNPARFAMTAPKSRGRDADSQPTGRKGWGAIVSRLPGLLFFAEAVSWIRCRLQDRPNRYLHISDGGHFENLAAYELIRRKCRYILISDCGQDPDREFADFGNFVRRVRVDFGVEIRIDLSPLRPSEDGMSPAHCAVGQIRYGKGDNGILLYVKPTLTGDEPSDIRDYLSQNPSFPHEPTGDQFYNEAQWEAYRRLGFHTAQHAFEFLSRNDSSAAEIVGGGAARVFSEARWRRTRVPIAVSERLTRLGEKFDALQRRWCKEAPPELVAQVLPELSELRGAATPPNPFDPTSPATVSLLLDLLRFFDDLYRDAELERCDGMAPMRGWRNLIRRCVRIEALRLWWPVLRSLFGNSFIDYLERSTDLGGTIETVDITLRDSVDLRHATDPIDVAHRQRMEQLGNRPIDGSSLARLSVPVVTSGGTGALSVAQLGYRAEGDRLVWHERDLFVLPGLLNSDWGTRLIGRFLDQIREDNRDWIACIVHYEDSERNRPHLESLSALYRPHGFALQAEEQQFCLLRKTV